MTDSKSEVVERLTKRAMSALRTQLNGQTMPTPAHPPGAWSATGDAGSVDVAAIVRGCLNELSAMGLVVVPREPTEEMVRAMTALAPTWDDETSRRKWAAAIAASKVQP